MLFLNNVKMKLFHCHYYADGIYVEYLIHMTYIRTIKMFILCRITTHEYIYRIPLIYVFFSICTLLYSHYLYVLICMGGSMLL